MSNIKLFSLGGVGEFGKNLYVVDVDDKIFILDAGSKNPPTEMFGVDSIIPDFTYLIENKDRIQGLFLTQAREDKIGAVPALLNHIRVNIYASKFTNHVLKDGLTPIDLESIEPYIHDVKLNTVLEFDEVKVSFFSSTHSLPEAYGIAIHTKDGVVLYTGDYSFNMVMTKDTHNPFSKLAKYKEEGVLALLSDSVGCTYASIAEGAYILEHNLREVMSKKGRVIVSSFSSEFDKIQLAVNLALEYDRKIAIIGRKAQRLIDIAINFGYLKIPSESMYNLKFIDSKTSNYDDDMVVLVTGEKHEPYFMLQRIARKRDKLIHIDERDTVVVMTIPLPGVEKMAANTIDVLYKSNAEVKVMKRQALRGAHASVRDTQLLYTMIQPKYVFPVLGEYRHQYSQYQVASNFGYDDNNIVMIDKGDVITFIDGEKTDEIGEIHVDDRLLDGSMTDDVNSVVLKDREILGRDGIIFIIGNIDARNHRLVSTPEVVAQGFMLERENPVLFQEIREIFMGVSQIHFKDRYIEWSDMKNDIKEAVQKHLYKTVNRTALVIPVLIDTVIN